MRHTRPDHRTPQRALISNGQGEAVAYALFNLQDRGAMFINPQDMVYQGMIIGEHSRDNDLEVNVLKGKKLTNVRASGSDEAVILTPPRRMSLEDMMAYINEDEYLEVTPESLRLRKVFLLPHERKKQTRTHHKPLCSAEMGQSSGQVFDRVNLCIGKGKAQE